MSRKITKRSDGRFVSYVLVPTLNGSKKRKYIYGKTRLEVKNKIINLEYEINNNLYVIDSLEILSGFLKKYLSVYCTKNDLADTTRELYEMYINVHINPKIGKHKVTELTPLIFKEFFNELNLSNKTKNKIYIFLNKAINVGISNKILTIKDNPLKYVPKFKEKDYIPDILTFKEYSNLINHVQGSVDEVIIAFASMLGLRRGEIFGLDWTNVDLEKGFVRIEKELVRFCGKWIEKPPKSNAGFRFIAMPNTLKEILFRWQLKKSAIAGKVITEYKPNAYSQRYKCILKDLGINHSRFHDLRHFNATLMMYSGIQDKISAKRLGHSDEKITREIYQHVIGNMDIESAQVIDKNIKKIL